MEKPKASRSIPLAAKLQLTPKTVQELQDYYDSDALEVTTTKGDWDPSKQRTKWINLCLHEKSSIAERCISRLFWHHRNGTTKLDNMHDFNFIVGLMHYDNGNTITLTREQEIAAVKVARALSVYEQEVYGYPTVTKTYGQNLTGIEHPWDDISHYVLAHPNRAESVCTIIRTRKVVDVAAIDGLLSTPTHSSMASGVL